MEFPDPNEAPTLEIYLQDTLSTMLELVASKDFASASKLLQEVKMAMKTEQMDWEELPAIWHTLAKQLETHLHVQA